MTSTGYKRFIILSDARTGSHMLAQALDSSPHIICFREIFNGQLETVQFDVEGYDNDDQADFALREGDPLRFLRERIFCEHPSDIKAVGFKYPYNHHWAFQGVLEELANDTNVYLLHLQRRNQLRMHVSLELARVTGEWIDGLPTPRPQSALSRAFKRLRQMSPAAPASPAKPRLHISPRAFYEFMLKTNLRREKLGERFQRHRVLDVFYEDIVEDQQAVFAEAQSFLNLHPFPLTVTTRRQNPEPLRELLENYDELYEAFKYTNAASYFD